MTALSKPARVLLLTLLVAAAMVIQFTVPASAAQLTVNHSGISTFSASACTDQVIAITAPQSSASQTQLQVQGVPVECAGTVGTAVVLDASGNALAQTTWTKTAGTNAVSTSAFDTSLVDSVLLLANGWWINTTWTAPAPSDPISCVAVDANNQPTGQGCSVTQKPGSLSWWWGQWQVPGTRIGQVEYEVSTPAVNAIVTIDFAETPYDDWSVTAAGTNGDWVRAPGYSCSEFPVARLYADPNKGGKTTSVWLQFTEKASQLQAQHTICPGP